MSFSVAEVSHWIIFFVLVTFTKKDKWVDAFFEDIIKIEKNNEPRSASSEVTSTVCILLSQKPYNDKPIARGYCKII